MSETTRALPVWAEERRYEYDLGMQTECFECGKAFTEGQIVYKDIQETEAWKKQGFLHMAGALYCSTECVWVAEEGTAS